jgi:hypothetical protein
VINTLDPLGNGNIFSDALGENISTNGYHEAIQVGDTVFDNINTNGHYCPAIFLKDLVTYGCPSPKSHPGTKRT